MSTARTYTHPSVLAGITAGASWADPTMDPTVIDWATRRAAAAIPFPLVNGRPVNPYAPTGIRYGRNELGHWGEQQCADAIVTAADPDGWRWLLLVERAVDHGCVARHLAEVYGATVFPAHRDLLADTLDH